MKRLEMNNDLEWLKERAEEEAGADLSVGGLFHRLSAPLNPAAERVNATSRTAFAKLIELRRRHRGLSVEQLAKLAGVDLAELVALEREGVTPQPQALHQLARVLKLPGPRLMQLAGLEHANDGGLDREAVRFAARSEPAGQLSPEEEEALDDFVKYLDRT